MESVNIKYGETSVDMTIHGAKSIKYLQGSPMKEIENLREAFLYEITQNCVDSPALSKLISKDDLVTIVVSDITRFWMRQDKICKLLVEYLAEELKVPYKNIVILIALGNHRKMTEEEMKKVVSPEIYEKVKVYNHNSSAPDLKYVGTTPRGTEVYVHPLAVDRKLILIGATVYHIIAGFGGGRKSILPGISSKKTINQNHMNSLDPNEAMSNPLVGLGKLKNNPVNEDMIDAASLINPTFGINLIVDSHSKHCNLLCGHWLKAWEKSCELVNEYFGVPIEKKADIVIASAGGYPKDISLYQSVKTLSNAAQALKKGGTMILLTECREGGGAPDYFDWIKSLKKGTLDTDLRASFTIPGYVFYATCEYINRFRDVFMLTQIPQEMVKDMNLKTYTGINDLLAQVDFTGKDVYVIPYGGNTVPIFRENSEN